MTEVIDLFKLSSQVFLYPGMAGWHFISIPKKESELIKKVFGMKSKGWGSIPVEVTLGKIRWMTSIFPDKKSGTYLLPIKAMVRKEEGIMHGDIITFTINIKT